ncbi:MAG: YetF domain-containing protein [Noviherbaspirillum sp.]
MSGLFDINWAEVFAFGLSPLELFARGSAMYWFLFLIFRFVVRRDVGSVGVADILILVIVADAAQNGMSGEYNSVPDGMVLVGTLIFWNVLLDRLSFRYKAFRIFTVAPPVCLVRNGELQRRNLRREYITVDELWTQMREQGVQSMDEVKDVYLESDGRFSVMKREK